MRSTWLLTPALAATALALPSQLTFSSPESAGLGSDALDLGRVLKDAWHGLQHSQPIGWADKGVREFSHRVQDAGISCAFPPPPDLLRPTCTLSAQAIVGQEAAPIGLIR